MAKSKTALFEAADYLDNKEVRLEYLKEAFETRDTEYIARAVGTKPNLKFSTVIKMLDSLGIELSVQPKQKDTETA